MLSRKVISGLAMPILYGVFYLSKDSLISRVESIMASSAASIVVWSIGSFIGGLLLAWFVFEWILDNYKKKHKPTPPIQDVEHWNLFKLISANLDKAKLMGNNPSIVIHYTFLSCDPFIITIDYANGYFKFDNWEASGTAMFEGEKQRVQQGGDAHFSIRQAITKEEAKKILEAAGKENYINIGTGRINITAIAKDEELDKTQDFEVNIGQSLQIEISKHSWRACIPNYK